MRVALPALRAASPALRAASPALREKDRRREKRREEERGVYGDCNYLGKGGIGIVHIVYVLTL